VIDDVGADWPDADQRRRDAFAHQHVVIRHRSPSPRGQVIERVICVFEELARAMRITARAWNEVIHAAISKPRKTQETP